jgi:16S rRNA C967 or C1407 C5-methylase (RsmB/RsmF family)/NOL1/NOP2/fmu family ribosome biogenesis protein
MSRRSHESTPVPFPVAFLARQNELLGTEADAFEAALAEPAVRALRVNERKTSLAEVAGRLGLTVDPVPWCPTATYLTPDMRSGDTVEHRAGLFYLQEPSSMAVVETLNIEPHHRVLDVAAAPGGKATHAASRLGPDGFLLANEVVQSRLGPLLANLDAWGYPNTAVASRPVSRLADAMPGSFDRVIVDAPCSGEALFRRQPTSRADWSEAHVTGAARRQRKLLAAAARAVAPGGLLAYSTCTFAPAENELQVGAFLDVQPGWELADISILPGAVLAPVDGVPDSRGHAIRFFPHRCRCEGQFIAILVAPGDPADHRPAVAARRKVPPQHPAWRAFAEHTLRVKFDQADVWLRGSTFYLLSSATGLPANVVLRPGLTLGRLAGSTFRPAHALAMALGPDDVSAVEALTEDELRDFRNGLPVRRPGPSGWVLVAMGRWPVGWARRKDNILAPRLPGHVRSRGRDQ